MPEHISPNPDTQFSPELPKEVRDLLLRITFHRTNIVAIPHTHWPLSPEEIHKLQNHKHQIPETFWKNLESSYPELQS